MLAKTTMENSLAVSIKVKPILHARRMPPRASPLYIFSKKMRVCCLQEPTLTLHS